MESKDGSNIATVPLSKVATVHQLKTEVAQKAAENAKLRKDYEVLSERYIILINCLNAVGKDLTQLAAFAQGNANNANPVARTETKTTG